MATLQDWLRNGWLREHKSSRQEIGELFAVADRDLSACQTPDLHLDWAFNIAYNASLQLATAALAAAGFKADRSNHHYRVIQSLELTIVASETDISTLDAFRKKRNVSDYERSDVVSEIEVGEIRALAAKLRRDVEVWIRLKHPELI